LHPFLVYSVFFFELMENVSGNLFCGRPP